MQSGGGACGPKPETKPLWLSSRSAYTSLLPSYPLSLSSTPWDLQVVASHLLLIKWEAGWKQTRWFVAFVGVSNSDCSIVFGCDTFEDKRIFRNTDKNTYRKNHHSYIINLWIPLTLQYRYAVCHGVPKSTTIPIPALPVWETPRVFLYLCQSLWLACYFCLWSWPWWHRFLLSVLISHHWLSATYNVG